jgi:acetylserotonin N-methyltransferase
MTPTHDTPDASVVIDLIDSFRRSQTMFAAVALGVFDRLHDGALSSVELAAAIGANELALRRLVEGCVALGLLRAGDGRFANTATAELYLRRASPSTLAGYILYSKEALYPMWGHLDDAVREGTPRWKQTFATAGGIFDGFFRTKQARAEFLLGMHGFGQISSPAVVDAFDLGRFRHMVDLGGGTGHLAMTACERYGALRATIYDLPLAIEEAQPYVARSAARERIALVAGDFFHDPLPGADLYALGRILHDWSDARAAELLQRVHAALAPGGAVLVADRLVDDDHCGPASVLMQSLNMLVCTEGRERTLAEFRALLEACGYGAVEGRRTGAPLDAVLAFKKE